MTQETEEIVREMDATRARMARDIDQLEARAAEKVRAVKQRLDVGQLVRDHPWPALGAAVVLGAIVGGGGADAKAASATKHAAQGAMEKLHSSDDAQPETRTLEPSKPGLGERLFDSLGAAVAGGLDRLIDEMRVASRDWGARMASSSRPPEPTVVEPTTAVAVVAPNDAADEVPVPREMLPAEVDARAEAVEALGGER